MKSGKRGRMVTVDHRLYPTSTQDRMLGSILSLCRETYNEILEMEIENYESGNPKSSIFDLINKLTEMAHVNLRLGDEVHCTCRNQLAYRVHDAMEGYVIVDGKHLHRPRFKSECQYHSFTYTSGEGFKFTGDRIRLSKIGSIRYRNERHPKGVMRTCTIKRDADGKWHALVTYETDALSKTEFDLDHPPEPEAYDLGLKDLITDTEGNKEPVPDFYAQEMEEIGKHQARMDTLEKGSPEWEKERRWIARRHQRIHRRRHGYLHTKSHDMVEGHSMVVVEDIRVRRMIEKKDSSAARRNRHTDASWGTLLRMAEYKAEWAGVPFIRVNPWNTSKTCSQCGHVKEELRLSERTYVCPCCGLSIDRDTNAARNILKKGLGTQACRGSGEGQGIPLLRS